jgi:hypothetical protein
VRAKRQSPSYGYDKLLDEALKKGYPYPTGKKKKQLKSVVD